MTTNRNKLPQFKNEEQEAMYWDTHSPLDLVSEPETQKIKVSKAKDRPIAIRLDSETRTRLNGIAAEQGVGPSTLARIFITEAIEGKKGNKKSFDMNLLMSAFANTISQAEKDKIESFMKEIAIGDPGNPALLVFSGQRKNWEDVASIFFKQLLAILGFQVITPTNKNFEKLKEIIQSPSPNSALYRESSSE
jgi:antitoxin component of RelBE/YafQ-DinJ toxin-antitoxin module